MIYNIHRQPAMTGKKRNKNERRLKKMANTMLKKVSVNVKLNNGTDSQGNVKTVNVGLGTLSTTGFNADKALAVVSLLGPCLSKTVYAVEKVEVSTLTAA